MEVLRLHLRRKFSVLVFRAIGVPLYMDIITAGQSRLVYAKVCVEIDANQIIPRTIDIILKDSSTRILWVDVPWIPQRCSKFSIFGHVDKACPKKLKEINKAHSEVIWVYKAKGKHKLSSSSQVKGKGVLLGSTNRFALLEDNQLAQDFSEHELDEGEENSPRKSRATASRVANLMKDIQQGVGANPWFLAGDFNVIADIKESLGSQCSSQLMRDIEEFLKCINGLELQDHSYFGPTYTWSNLQKESYLARKLDSDD
ncbi:hypothetical protein GOBAR_DD31697 [Gossypium barbadense]|nr:hypothetical protein GOBAR_DD31697 [Gossypium barbadense]